MVREAPRWRPPLWAQKLNSISNKCLSCGAVVGGQCKPDCCYRLEREKQARYNASDSKRS